MWSSLYVTEVLKNTMISPCLKNPKTWTTRLSSRIMSNNLFNSSLLNSPKFALSDNKIKKLKRTTKKYNRNLYLITFKNIFPLPSKDWFKSNRGRMNPTPYLPLKSGKSFCSPKTAPESLLTPPAASSMSTKAGQTRNFQHWWNLTCNFSVAKAKNKYKSVSNF